MRLLIAAGALTLLATPAFAQRLDTRRIDVLETETATTCDFNAYPITLVDGTKAGKGKIATWRSAPDDAKPEDRNRFEFVFERSEDWRKPMVLGLGAQIYKDDALTTDTVGSAMLRLDGTPITTSYNASRDKLIFAATRDLDALGARLVETSTLQLDIMNKDGRIIRSYWWDVHRLGEGLETVSVVNWSCAAP